MNTKELTKLSDVDSMHDVMSDYLLPMISDVLSDCGLSGRSRRDIDDLLLLEKMTSTLECSPMDGIKGDACIHDLEALKKVKEELENGQCIQHVLCDPEVTLTSAMWPPHGDDNFPEEVLLEVEVISSWEEARDDRTVIDLDGSDVRGLIGSDVRCLDGTECVSTGIDHLDGSDVKRILDECSDSSGEFSDYGSDSGTENMDLSQSGGTLDLSSSKKDSSPAPGSQTAVVNLTRAHIPTHLTGTVFDMSQVVGYNNNSYLHYSGGTTTSLDVIPRSGDVIEQNVLLDLSKTGQYNSNPLQRVKLDSNLIIDPSIQYKPEMDYNHNEALPSTIHPSDTSKYKTVVYDEDCIAYKPGTPELNQLYSKPDSTDIDMYSDAEPRVKVEQNYSSQCQNIPLTVTSPDDAYDSGTDSISSNSSEKSRDSKTDRKRPGRKKGQVSKVYHLWEFIRDVLADPRYCPSVIKWENEEEGIFRVVQSETAASLWGARKNNRTKMTYEKMSRSIRYSRKEGYFADIPKDKGYPKKLCFKFGKKAHGWSAKFKK